VKPATGNIKANPGERGFALLIVFLLAAAIALMLYQQMPRVAFESERDKEELLIDRGEQFKRAIQLYVAINKRYPARIEDLENTNDKRFLRKRYIDPFTGKKEWRLVHTNGMMLTDSLVQKPPAAPGDDKNKDTSTVASNTTGANNGVPGTGAQPDVNGTVLQRPSDRTLPTGIPGQFGVPQGGDPSQQQVGVGPGGTAFPPITLSQLQGQQGAGQGNIQSGPGGVPIQFPNQGNGQFPLQPGQLQPGQLQPGQLQPGQLQPGQLQPGQLQPGQLPPGQFQPGQGVAGQLPPGQGQFPQGAGGQGLQGNGALQGGAAGGQNNAINLINQLLTSPRTPPAGIGTTPPQNNAMGGGIAGVASTYEGPSIKSYNTRTKFNEWEFVFQNQQQGVPGQTNGQPNGQPNAGQQTGNQPLGGMPPGAAPPAQ